MFRAKSFNRTKLSYKTQTENKTKKLDLDENGKFYQYIVQGFSCQRLFVTWISIFFFSQANTYGTLRHQKTLLEQLDIFQ